MMTNKNDELLPDTVEGAYLDAAQIAERMYCTGGNCKSVEYVCIDKARKAKLNTRTQPEAVDVDYLNKQIEFHYQIMAHSENSEVVKNQSTQIYHALCDVKHHLAAQGYLKTQPSEDVQKALDELIAYARDCAEYLLESGHEGKAQSLKLKCKALEGK